MAGLACLEDRGADATLTDGDSRLGLSGAMVICDDLNASEKIGSNAEGLRH